LSVRTESRLYRFGSFTLDAGRRRLTRDGEPVWLQHRHMEVLLLLAANAGHLISKDALGEAVWDGVAVSDNSIDKAISAVRQALGHPPGEAAFIEMRRGRGFVFIAPIESVATSSAPASVRGRC
jgi:DNA-binding winged helix-turn-helix (wHTH) protein